MAELKVNLEEGGGCYYAHATEFLGCFSKAYSRSEAIDAILKDVKQYSKWLLSIDFDNIYKAMCKEFLAGINELNVVEELKGFTNLSDSTGASALFKSDIEMIPEDMFEFYITIINKLPDELMRIVFQYSKEEREQELLPGKPTINDELKDIYITELFFICRFGEGVEEKFFDAIKMTKDELDSLTLLERVVKVRQGATAILRSYYPKLTDNVVKNAKDEKHPDEQWTIKKVIRKFIEHERERTNTIRALVEVLEEQKASSETTE
ncbi:MAG: hypothetical protein KGD59_12110 [Candidatus Heimdallarchaeota archaeon]|nr:hypothetical protein [Candidatus Heimdallarchaeota archaeon]MBY8995288.1 hypothetical protein [Candidatus Heimdallarchaeota archaeon]